MLQVNLKNNAISQTTENYTAMCKFGDEYIGVNSLGLYRVDGYSDGSTEIPALIKSGEMDFGLMQKKRFRFFYFGLATNGVLRLKVYRDGVLAASHTVQPSTKREKTVRIPISRDHQGRYWSWSIENISGAFFALYSVQAIPVILHPNLDQ